MNRPNFAKTLSVFPMLIAFADCALPTSDPFDDEPVGESVEALEDKTLLSDIDDGLKDPSDEKVPATGEAPAPNDTQVSAGSIAPFSNTGFKQRKNVFPFEGLAVATIDRLVDRATILRFSGTTKREPQTVTGPRLG